MNYFDYLRITNKKDVKDTFIEFLINYMDYTKDNAERYSSLFYNEKGELKQDTLF